MSCGRGAGKPFVFNSFGQVVEYNDHSYFPNQVDNFMIE
jgi:hypothetical protein